MYLMPETLYEGKDVAALDNENMSDISWADSAHGGCPGTLSFAVADSDNGYPEAAVGSWPVSHIKFASSPHRLRIAQSPLDSPDFYSAPGQGAALMVMFRVVNSPTAGPSSSDLIRVDGSGSNASLSELWVIQYHPQNSSVDCVLDGTARVTSSPGRIRLQEWYVLECHLSDTAMLTLRINGEDEGGGPGTDMPVLVDPVPTRAFLLRAPELIIGHVRSRVRIDIAAVVVHDEAFSDLETDIIEEHITEQLAAVYPDTPEACPGGQPPAEHMCSAIIIPFRAPTRATSISPYMCMMHEDSHSAAFGAVQCFIRFVCVPVYWAGDGGTHGLGGAAQERMASHSMWRRGQEGRCHPAGPSAPTSRRAWRQACAPRQWTCQGTSPTCTSTAHSSSSGPCCQVAMPLFRCHRGTASPSPCVCASQACSIRTLLSR